jgi:hypothetical protein
MPRRFVLAVAASLLSGSVLAAGAPPPSAPPAAAAPSPAAIGRCLWQGLPNTTRQALVASGTSVNDVSKALDNLDQNLLDVARSQCPAPAAKADAEKAAEAWTAVVLSAWSSAELATHYKVGDAALQRAWSHFTPAQRQAFEADESKPPDTERANVASMTRELGLTTPEATDLLIFWSLSQLHLAALGG